MILEGHSAFVRVDKVRDRRGGNQERHGKAFCIFCRLVFSFWGVGGDIAAAYGDVTEIAVRV